MSKIARNGRSDPIDYLILSKLREATKSPKYRLLWDLLYFTGARIGAAIKLRREDCYLNLGVPRLAIIFRSQNLKQGAGRYQKSIEVPIAKPLKLALMEYKFESDLSPWLFEGKDREHHVSRQSCDRNFRKALKVVGLDRAGYSLHGFKRNFIQRLHQENASFAEIKALTGNQSLKSIQSYLEGNPQKMKSLIDRIF